MKNIKQVDHHISEYTKIITQLKDEISDLKYRLSSEQAPLAIANEPYNTNERKESDMNNVMLEEFLEKLSSHFEQETKLVKRVDELK